MILSTCAVDWGLGFPICYEFIIYSKCAVNWGLGFPNPCNVIAYVSSRLQVGIPAPLSVCYWLSMQWIVGGALHPI